ncbi:filamentous hemagglutinin N-terminal domain-containing protein, partial [Burkholderia sp. DN3021]|uniref:two-partner secretion domain-containing protein n=1 Tax=Burkholderia sp. DN3021 TaxID=3410137 RepID=UPI003C7CEF03
MNQQAYKIKFSRRAGTWVAVSELTRGASKGSGGGTGASTSGAVLERFRVGGLKRLVAALVLGGMLPGPTWAQVVSDPGAGANRPGVTTTANGTDLVHIVKPNAAGLSHNKFSEFSPVGRGVVLNNSAQSGVSQIGGFAMGNPNLSAPAKAALLEVTQQRSALQGTLESFGGKLDVLVANPHGVTINGLTTLNVGRFGVSTGQVLPQADGSVRLGVTQGDVLIERGGIDTKGLSVFDVVSRSIVINGPVSDSSAGGAKADVNMVAGLTTYDPRTGQYEVNAANGSKAPALGISGGALGAMYGRHIVLASTESGVGVRHDGAITSVNDIRVSANGEVKLGGAVRATQGTMNISTPGSVTLNGAASAGQDVVLQGGSVRAGQVSAQRDVSVTATGDVALNGAV